MELKNGQDEAQPEVEKIVTLTPEQLEWVAGGGVGSGGSGSGPTH